MEKTTLKYIADNQLSSFMNNTKWKELVRMLKSNPDYDPEVKIKYLFENEPSMGFSTICWKEVERDGFELIQWIKINPTKEVFIGRLVSPDQTDYSDLIEKGLTRINIPYEFDEGIFTIYGYK